MDYVITRAKEDETDELMHYGVKGMKWGHRKALPTPSTYNKVQSTKAQYKQAKKDYNKAYNKAYSYSSRHTIGQFTNKKKKAESDRRWNDAYDKANAVEKAKTDYKQAKAERKNKINSTYRDIQKNTSLGEKLIYNDATRRKAAKYVVDRNMTMQDATAKANADAVRNTGIILATWGGITLASLYASGR